MTTLWLTTVLIVIAVLMNATKLRTWKIMDTWRHLTTLNVSNWIKKTMTMETMSKSISQLQHVLQMEARLRLEFTKMRTAIMSTDSNSLMRFSRMFTVVVIFHALPTTKTVTVTTERWKKLKHVRSSTKMLESVNHTMDLLVLIIIAQIKPRTKKLFVTLFHKSKKVHMMLRLVKSFCKETER